MRKRNVHKKPEKKEGKKRNKNIISGFLALLFPNLCLSCRQHLLRNENYLCLDCLYEIPKTNFHLEPNNPLERLFWGKAPIVCGTAFFFFQKGSSFQQILHLLKYKGEKEIGFALGQYASADLIQSSVLMSTDIIVPVPLHPKRLKSRGYNQSEWIAKGLAEMMHKPINTTNLKRSIENVSQTKKNVFERHQNTQGIFEVQEKAIFEGKHLLLVDDVITTGATLAACMQALLEIRDIKISVFTLAIA